MILRGEEEAQHCSEIHHEYKEDGRSFFSSNSSTFHEVKCQDMLGHDFRRFSQKEIILVPRSKEKIEGNSVSSHPVNDWLCRLGC